MNMYFPRRRARRALGSGALAATVVCTSFVVALAPIRAAAATCTDSWIGGVDSSWFTPGNWTAGVPDNTKDVCIGDITTGTYTVTVDGAIGNASVASLTLGGGSGTQTLAVDSASLNLSADSAVSIHGALVLEGVGRAVVSLNAFTLSNAGSVSVLAGGDREIGSGTVVNTGTLTIDTDTNTASLYTSPMTLVNEGAVGIASGATLNVPTLTNSSGTITNNGQIVVYDFTQGAGSTSPNPIEFNIGGTFHRVGGGAVQVVVPDGRQLFFDGSLLGSGQTIDLVGGLLSLSQDLTNNSSIVLEGAGRAVVSLNGWTLSNAGSVSVLAGGDREIGSGTVVNTGTLTIDTDTNTANLYTTPMTFTQTRAGRLETTIDATGSVGRLSTTVANLAGTLAVTTVGSPVGPNFDVVLGSAINGRFSTLDYGSRLYETTYPGTSVTLSLPGNYQYGDLSLSSRVAGASGVTYTVGFEGPALTSGSSTLTLTASPGTVFPTASACGIYTVTDTTTSTSSTCPVVSGGGNENVTVTAPFSAAARDHLVLTINGVTNTSPNGSYSLTLANGVNELPLGFVLDGSAAPVITSADNTAFTVGAPGSFLVTATGGPLPSLSANGALPSWASLVDHGDGTATLSGTPPTGSAGVHVFTLTAANGVVPDATQSFTLTVNQAPAITSANATTFTVGSPGSFTTTATGFPTPTWSMTGTLPAGVTFNTSTHVLSGTPAAGTGGVYLVTFTASNGVTPNAGQIFTLTVNEAPAITSANNVTFTEDSPGSFTATATGFPTPTWSGSGALPAGVTFNTVTHVLSGTPATGTGGTYPITITASNGVSPNSVQNFTLTVSAPSNQAPAITSANATTFTVGVPGSFTATATGFPTPTWSSSGALPAGVTFNTTTHVLSGTPVAGTGGVYPITITASNGVAPNAVQSFTLTVHQAPAITSANAVTFTVGTAGSFTATATGFPALSWSSSGTLPAGVTFNTVTHVLSGTPAAGTGGVYPITITAGNGVLPDAVQNFTLTVNQAPAITSANNTTFTVGSLGSFTVTGTGFPALTWSSSGTLPSGVTFNTATHVLSGTPAAGTGGTYNITFTAANGVALDATQNFTLTVNQAPAITSANATTFTVGSLGSFTATATGFPAPTWSSTGLLPSGVTFNPATHVLSGTPAAGTGGVYPITITAGNGVSPDATQNFTLTVSTSTPPAFTSANATTFTVGSLGSFTVTATGGPVPSLSASPALPSWVSFVDHGDGTATLSGTPTAGAGGTYNLTFTASNGVSPNATQNFTLTVNQAPAITSANNVTFTVGVPGSFTATATGFPTSTWSSTGLLPSGVTFNPATHVLSGTPAAGTGGVYPITITASNGVLPNAVQNFTLTVNQAPAITSANNTTFTVGSLGSFTATATGFPTPTWSSTGLLPSGVTFNTTTHVLSGTPAAGTGGVYNLTFTASNGVSPNATQNFTLTVNQAPAITSANNVTFTVGSLGSFTTTATGFPTPTWSSTGALPAGVTFNTVTHVLSGTPAAGTGGVYPITITASNGVAPDAVQNFTLTVNQAPAITSANNVTFTVGSLGSFTTTATGFPTPTWSTTGALPAGVTFNTTTHVLSGTPAAGTGGVYNLTFTASNGVSPNATQNFTLTVNQPPAITSPNNVTFTVGVPGSFTATATGFPTPTWSTTGALPAGVTFNTVTHVLSGTPTAGTAGVYNITFTASNGVTPNATQNFTLTVIQAASADLRLQITQPAASLLGDGFVVSLAVTNFGPNAASATSVVATIDRNLIVGLLPAGCTQLAVPAGAQVTCVLGTVPATGVPLPSIGIPVRSKVVGGSTTCTVWGTSGADVLNGTAGPDVICGLGGGDTIDGLGSVDTVFGDTPPGATGYTAAVSGSVSSATADPVAANNGSSASTSVSLSAAGADTIAGGTGGDTLYGQEGADTLYGDIASPSGDFRGSGVADTIEGGTGGDTILGQGGDDNLYGAAGNDTIYGQDGMDTIYGQDGDDVVSGNADSDTLYGNNGVDTIYGDVTSPAGEYAGSGVADTIDGGPGADTILGQGGDDTIEGGAGNDTIYGQDGADSISGGADSDTIEGNSGDDTIFGDVLSLAGAYAGTGVADTIDGGPGADTILGQGGGDTIEGGVGGDTIYGQDGADSISGGLGSDTIEGNNGGDTIYGDVMSPAGQYAGTGDADIINGGPDADKIIGQGGGDTLSGGAGDDDIYGQDGPDVIVGNADDDHLYGNAGNDTLAGASGNDTIEGDAGNDRLDGGTLTPDPARPTRIVQRLDCGAGIDTYSNGPVGESQKNCEILG